MIDRPMNRRNQNAKKPIASGNSVKARKWEKLVGWSVEPDYDNYYIDIEAWSKRRYTECTSGSSIEYLCSNDHFCDGILDWDGFIDASLEKHEGCKIDTDCENTGNNNELKTDEVYEQIDKLTLETTDLNIETGNDILNTGNVEQTEDTEKNVGHPSCKASKELINSYSSKHRSVKVRPISSNSLPEKAATHTPPRRHALSANDTYIDFPDSSALSNKVKFSYTKKQDPKQVKPNTLNHSSNDNDVTETYQNDVVSSYDFHHLQLHKRYVLPKSARVSIGDLLHSHPRIERHYARDMDIVFAALANEKDTVLPKASTQLSFDNNTDSNKNSLGLPPVNQKPNNDNSDSKHAFKNVASMPRIPLLAVNTSKSADETLLKHMSTNRADPTEETTHSITSLHSYVTHSRCNDVDANYIPKTVPSHLQEYYTTVIGTKKKVKQPRGLPSFRGATSKTPLHRAIESAHKKIHGPYHRLLSKSSSRLTDTVVEAPIEKRRWSSSLPKSKQYVGLEPEVNNTVAWRKELESHIRYQRSTLSRRKKTQLRIGDTLYNVGTCAAQSAGRTHTRISVER